MSEQCCLCPRMCGADRSNGNLGYCQSDEGYHISSICMHHGEEPVISGSKGICNIFFSRCNLQCIYCQNHQISTLGSDVMQTSCTLEEIVKMIEFHLDNGCIHVGFVSPSHMVPQVRSIITALRSNGRNPVFVYNSNAYERVETLKTLEGLIDVYLPDFKYMAPELAKDYSGAQDYPRVALAAIKEMYRQKGSTLIMNDNLCARSGLIIRHLVLPGHVENSKAVLKAIACELSPLIHVSLMSQYYPTPSVMKHSLLCRPITTEEYEEVLDEMAFLGICRGWVQEPESPNHYKPDFTFGHPFESK